MGGAVVAAFVVEVLLLEGRFDLLTDVVLLLLEACEFGGDAGLDVGVERRLAVARGGGAGGRRPRGGGEVRDEGFRELQRSAERRRFSMSIFGGIQNGWKSRRTCTGESRVAKKVVSPAAPASCSGCDALLPISRNRE